MLHSRLTRLCAALAASLVLSAVLPAAAVDDNDAIKEAKEERDEARQLQLAAKIELELVKAEDLEVVEALEAATELVNLQQAKIDAANQRLETSEEAYTQAVLDVAATAGEIAELQEEARRYAVEAYIDRDVDRTEAWLNADDATDAAHKVALLDTVGTESFDVLDQLRSIEDRREQLLADADAARIEADAIKAELSTALVDLEAQRQLQLELKAEVDERRARWERELAKAEQEEEELTAFIQAERERIERELEAARQARIAAATVENPAVGIISDGGWTWPTAGRVASGFGQRLHPILGYYRMHSGLDIGGAQGAPIWAAHDGIVQLAGWNGGYGNTVILAHGDNTTSLYAHMSSFAVGTGEYVVAGQVIGYVGSTGLSTGPHLHFEVRLGGSPVNPRPYLP